MAELEKEKIVGLLNHILEQELAGVVRYTHYSFLVFGHNRIPIVSWLREQAAESLTHAQQAGEMITLLGAYPSLKIGPLLDSHKHDVGAILREDRNAVEGPAGGDNATSAEQATRRLETDEVVEGGGDAS